MTLELELAVRFLRRRAGVLLRGTSLAAFVGVALATAALVITLALMAGYSQAIADALQRGNAHVVGFFGRAMGLEAAADLAARIATVNGVRRATPVNYLAGLMDDPARPTTPVPITIKAISEPPAYGGLAAWPEGGGGIPALFGERLGSSLKLAVGDPVAVRLPPEPGSWIVPTITLVNAGTFRLAFAEFDSAGWSCLWSNRAASRDRRRGNRVEIATARGRDGPYRARGCPARAALHRLAEMNRSLFAVCGGRPCPVRGAQPGSGDRVVPGRLALVVLAIDKRQARACCSARRHPPSSGGCWCCRPPASEAARWQPGSWWVRASWLMTALRVVRFQGLARVCMVDSIPFRPEPYHLLAVLAVCMVLVFLASLGPAWRTSREDPVASLRAV
jgi:hypothetical protein